MFNLGYKEVILNEVTADSAYITHTDGREAIVISGYTTFFKDQIAVKSSAISVNKQAESSLWGLPTITTSAAYFEVTIELKSKKTDRKKKIYFTTLEPTISGIVSGYNKYLTTYDWHNAIIALTEETGKLKVTVSDKAPEVDVFMITARAVSDEKTINYRMMKSVLTEGNSGTFYGHHLEESKRLGTVYNVSPYGSQQGGNSQGIVLNGRYKGYYIKYRSDDNWGHEFISHTGVNAQVSTQELYFSMYVLDYKDNIKDFDDLFDFITSGIFNSIFDNTFN